MRIQVECSQVRIHASVDVSDQAVIGLGTSIWRQSQVREGAMIRYAVNKAEPLRLEFETFIQYIQEGKYSKTNCDEAAKALELILAMIEITQNGTVVNLSND
jgi:predicted dehydrogenase